MSLARFIRAGKNLARIGIRKANPWLVQISLQDRLGNPAGVKSSRRSLDATIKWLCRAQDRCGGYGVSAGYSFLDGWYPPYPE
ncbi:MAG: prenyltransferase/squalene oxidase repeat-containing protein, partial [Blastocatellia bacterium]